jgi:predicted esterase
VDEGTGDGLMATASINVPTRTHGRVLVREAARPTVVLVGFHGYMESAATQMERLASIPGAERWTLVSVQALHRFYRGRSEEVVASWMTRQDRELMIEDNIAYVNEVLERVAAPDVRVVTAGFSQGAAMGFRAGVRARHIIAGIVAVGGDVPPELLADPEVVFPRVLIGRGERDEWYTGEKAAKDVAALRARGVEPDVVVHSAGHEWTPDVSIAVSTFVRSLAGQ